MLGGPGRKDWNGITFLVHSRDVSMAGCNGALSTCLLTNGLILSLQIILTSWSPELWFTGVLKLMNLFPDVLNSCRIIYVMLPKIH